MKPKHLIFFALLIVTLVIAVAGAQRATKGKRPAPPESALDAITSDGLMRHIKKLSSDEFEGRGPGTRGEELTVKYLAEQFQRIGLKPGNTDGTYFQKVPMVGITTNTEGDMSIEAGHNRTKLAFGKDFVARTTRIVEKASLDADMVFVGYGVVAPEYGWDDYKGLDVAGKVMVVLVGDPPVPDPSDSARLDPKMFAGRAITYYGRWTYKFEIAAQKGAAGVLIVHETGPAGYPWAVPRASFTLENCVAVAKDNNMSAVNVEGWITDQSARALFSAVGKDFDSLKHSAIERNFKPAPLDARARLTVRSKTRPIDSTNVLGKLEGSDPKLKDEYVVYMAHWDHLGIGPDDLGKDRIYNGAVDNASGTAGLMEIAAAYRALETPARRSILFLAVTAEEKGLIGSKYYAENPVYPLEKTVAAINMDGLNQWGRTHDITVVGLGNSTLDDVLRAAAAAKGRVVGPDPEPEKGFYYRSDHFNFAKQGVPALNPGGGMDYLGKPKSWGRTLRDEYTKNDYHKPSDEIKPDWNLDGAVDDLRLFFTVGYEVANTTRYPQWKPGTEFKARREEMLKKAGIRPIKHVVSRSK